MKVASGILPIAADSQKICLGWRSPEVREGNRWGVIGGTVKPEMTPEQGALTELHEEVGYFGPIELHRAFLCHRKGFEYHNFIGVVPTAFHFEPMPEFAWETSFISWLTFGQIQQMVEQRSLKFHKGLLQLLHESREQIEGLCTTQQLKKS